MFEALLSNFMPGLLDLVAVIAGIILSAVLFEIKRRFGIDIKVQQGIEIDQLRQRLSEALINAAHAAIADAAEDGPGYVLEYLQKGIPDVLEKLGGTDDVLRARAQATLGSVRNSLGLPR